MARAVAVDLWVCHHFRVLPTEERFKKLTSRQKDLLYVGWVELPTSDQIKEWNAKKLGDPTVTPETAKEFRKLGYTPDQIRKIKEQLKNAGFQQPD